MPSRIIFYAKAMRWALADNEPALYDTYSRRVREFIRYRGYSANDISLLLTGRMLGY